MITWQTLEFEEKDRHPDWVWYVGLIFGIAATLAFFYGNIFFGIFLVVAGTLVIIFAFKKPETLTITLEEKALRINADSIDYPRIKQFWIDETQKPAKLLVLVSGSLVPMLVLQINDVIIEEVREELKKHSTEVAMRESFGVKVFERLGF